MRVALQLLRCTDGANILKPKLHFIIVYYTNIYFIKNNVLILLTCIVLYYTIVYCTVLYLTVLYCTVPYYTIQVICCIILSKEV